MDEYPTDGSYRLRQKTVRAIYFDGTKAKAHEILAYVFHRNGEGHIARRSDTYSEEAFGLHIDGIEGYIPEGSWIVSMHEQNNFVCMDDVEFKLTYELIPQGLTYREGGDIRDGSIRSIRNT